MPTGLTRAVISLLVLTALVSPPVGAGKARQEHREMRGTIFALDVEGKELVISVGGGKRQFLVSAKTETYVNGERSDISRLKKGDPLVIFYRDEIRGRESVRVVDWVVRVSDGR